MKITHLLYRSYTQAQCTPKQAEKIFEISVKSNDRNQVTGIFLYRAKMVLQLLEGNEAEVMRCFSLIRDDSRHFGAGILLKLESDKRLFSNLCMGHIPEEKALRPFTNIEAVLEATGPSGQPNRATIIKIIKNFADPEALLPEEKAAA